MCDKCKEAQRIIQEWTDKQGHERCWYYPDLFRELVNLFEITPSVEPNLPPQNEFETGCKKYQQEEYKNIKPVWGCKNWGNYEHDWLDCHDCLNEYERYTNVQDNLLSPMPFEKTNNTRNQGNDHLDTGGVCNYFKDFEAPGC